MSKNLEFVEMIAEGRIIEAKILMSELLDEACKKKMMEQDDDEEMMEPEMDDTEDVGEKEGDEAEEEED